MTNSLLLYSVIGGAASLFGGLLLLWKPGITKKYMTPLLGFGAGAFLAASFIDIIPEAMSLKDTPQQVMVFVLCGFLGFFILERFLMRSFHMHKGEATHSEHTETLPYLLVLGDSFHNFLDGILIGFASLVNPATGLSTAIAVASHELPQEMADFSIMIRQGWSKKAVLGINIAQSFLTIPGAFIGYSMGSTVGSYVAPFLGITAGMFIYIAATDILPELHHNSSHTHFFRVVVPTLVGVIFVLYFSFLER